MKQINIPPIRIPEFRMPSLGLSAIGLPADRSGNRLAWPSGLKDSIVCWYSPRKQGLTEYDVIESYAEDFTSSKFNVKDANTTVTNKVLTYSRDAVEPTTSSILTTKEQLDEMVVKVTFDVSAYSYRYLDKNLNLIDIKLKNGINVLPKSYSNNFYQVGFIYTGNKYATNITIEQLPTSKAKDFSANGHDLFLYKFKGKLDSGIGLYHADFTEWTNSNSDEVSPEQVVFTTAGVKNIILYGTKSNSINVQVKGFSDKVRYLRLGYNENGVFKEIDVFKDGIYTIPGSELETSGLLSRISCSLKDDSKVTVTQTPDYPNQLCYNGSSYGVAYGLPLLSDYTIIADRTWFENNGNRVFANKGNIWPNCAFTFEKIDVSLNSETFSFSQSTGIDDLRNKSGITYQTKQSYNGNPISFGDSSDGEVLAIGGQITGEFVGCHGDILLFNRTLTDDEITWLKENWEKL